MTMKIQDTVRVMVTMWCDSEGDTSEGEGVIVRVCCSVMWYLLFMVQMS